jgi:hypothetical protein
VLSEISVGTSALIVGLKGLRQLGPQDPKELARIATKKVGQPVCFRGVVG